MVDPSVLHPFDGRPDTVFLKPLLERLLAKRAAEPEAGDVFGPVTVGEYSYHHSFDDPTRFFERSVRYHYGLGGGALEIGRFCAIAHGVVFLGDDANHAVAGPSTFPFPLFGGSWAEAASSQDVPFLKKGPTIVGHDVWIGHGARILPGVTIGHGAIIGAEAVVSRDAPPYAVVAGNPARVVRMRYGPEEIERLLALAWWDWPPDRLAAAVPDLIAGPLERLLAR